MSADRSTWRLLRSSLGWSRSSRFCCYPGRGRSMTDAHTVASTTSHDTGAAGSNLSLISTQLSWMRSDLSNLRALLAWARTSVSMIGFGFTIYNFYRGFLENLANGRGTDAARNLGLALVEFGTLAM